MVAKGELTEMRNRIIRLIPGLIYFAAVITACTIPMEEAERPPDGLLEPGVGMKKISSWTVPVFEDDMPIESLYSAIESSFEYYGRLDPNRRLQFGKETYTALELQDFLKDFINIMASTSPGSARHHSTGPGQMVPPSGWHRGLF